jgi:hypothetical protein
MTPYIQLLQGWQVLQIVADQDERQPGEDLVLPVHEAELGAQFLLQQLLDLQQQHSSFPVLSVIGL